MSDDLLQDFGLAEGEWIEPAKKEAKVEESEWEDDSESESYGLNIGFVAYEMKGKSLLYSLLPYVNSDFFDKFDVKEKYPLCYEMLHSGLIPEVEQLFVLDLDNSYKKLSKLGIFGDLVAPLYAKHLIKRKTIKIPKRQVKYADGTAREVAKLDIQKTKFKIENQITKCVKDNHPGQALAIDSMSAYDKLLNDWFRIVFEDFLVDPDQKGEVGTALKGIRQSYYQIRNGWWIETLRDKRSYPGWNIDTYKKEPKTYKYLKLEMDSAHKVGKKPADISPDIIHWATKTEFELDMVFHIDNDGTNYYADLKSRFEGNKPRSMNRRIPYSPSKRRAIYEIIEGIAPYIMGMVEKEEGVYEKIPEEDLW